MSRDAIEVGAFTWSRILRLYDPDAATHWQRRESDGLKCSLSSYISMNSPQLGGVLDSLLSVYNRWSARWVYWSAHCKSRDNEHQNREHE